MIWISIPLMTTIDAMIIAVTVYAIWSSQLIAPSRRPSEPKTGLRWIALGLLLVCLFILVISRACTFCPSLRQWT
jgi:hypothetical protein